MHKQLSVSFESMRETVQSLQRATAEIETLLATLDAESQRLSGGWTGQAQEAFAEAKRSWANDMHGLTSLLDQASSALSAATDRFQQAETRNSALWPI